MVNAHQPGKMRDPLQALMGYQLRRASLVMMADLARSLLPTGLRPVEASILLVIESSPGCTQSDVGKVLGVKRANMVPLVASLSSRDLVYRTRVDGRSQALFLSAAGEALVKAVHEAIDAHEARFQSRFTDDARGALIESLMTIRNVDE